MGFNNGFSWKFFYLYEIIEIPTDRSYFIKTIKGFSYKIFYASTITTLFPCSSPHQPAVWNNNIFSLENKRISKYFKIYQYSSAILFHVSMYFYAFAISKQTKTKTYAYKIDILSHLQNRETSFLKVKCSGSQYQFTRL